MATAHQPEPEKAEPTSPEPPSAPVPVPTSSVADEAIEGNRRTWLERKFRVSELVKRFPGEAEAIRRYAPTEGEYAGTSFRREG